MAKLESDKNIARLVGMLRDVKFDHEFADKTYMKGFVDVIRPSGIIDHVPVMIPESKLHYINWEDGAEIPVSIIGQVKTYNSNGRVLVFIQTDGIKFDKTGEQINEVEFSGHICKQVSIRKTPMGRDIAELMIASNKVISIHGENGFDKLISSTSYIPTIAFDRWAYYATSFGVGNLIEAAGRFQSRTYIKTLEDGTVETREAYEVCVNEIW